MRIAFLAASTLLLAVNCSAFVVSPSIATGVCQQRAVALNAVSNNIDDRRTFLAAGLALPSFLATAFPAPSVATLMAPSEEGKTFKPGEKLSVAEARDRFGLARKDVQYLLDNYAEISASGGDNVRRYLGTVGVTGYMYGITKVLKDLRDEAEDIVEFQETLNEFEAYLYQAEGAAYQSLFVEHSSSKGTPETFLATAKKDVVSMQKYMDNLAVQLKL